MPTKNRKPNSPQTARGTRRAPGAQPNNTNAQTHGFYSDRFTLEELTLLAACTAEPTLSDEIWLQRVLNRRLVTALNVKKLPQKALLTIAAALAVGTGRVARLLRDKRALSEPAAAGLAEAVAIALSEIASETGMKL